MGATDIHSNNARLHFNPFEPLETELKLKKDNNIHHSQYKVGVNNIVS